MSPLGVGTDLGGSVRVPAAACGVVSLKVTWGRVADAYVVAPPQTRAIAQMDTTGPMARRVADLRIALDLLRRPSNRDDRYRDVDLPGSTAATRFMLHVPDGTHPDIARALVRASDALEDGGWMRRQTAPPDFGAALDLWLALIGHDVVELTPILEQICGDQALMFIALMRAVIPPIDDDAFEALFVQRAALVEQWAAYQARTPLVLAPVMTQPTYAAGTDLTDPLSVTASLACVPPLNALGLPAAVVPIGSTGGLPIGAQLIGPAWREDICLAAAATLEAALGPVEPIDPR
jgi:amidase